jgi:hypothetical protein
VLVGGNRPEGSARPRHQPGASNRREGAARWLRHSRGGHRGKPRRRGTPSWGSEGNKQITRDVVDDVAPNFGWTAAG